MTETRCRTLSSNWTFKPDRRRSSGCRCCGVLVPMVVAVTLAIAGPVWAATCTVPSGSCPTIQSAIDVPSCSPIVVAARTYSARTIVSRSLEPNGAGSSEIFFQGGVGNQAGGVSTTGINLSGPGEALWSHSGDDASGCDLEIVPGSMEAPLFADCSENGATGTRNAVVPSRSRVLKRRG